MCQKIYPVEPRLAWACLRRNIDRSDVPSFAFTELLSDTAVGFGRNNADFSLGRVVLIGGSFLMPCLLAKSDLIRHKGNFSAKIFKAV